MFFLVCYVLRIEIRHVNLKAMIWKIVVGALGLVILWRGTSHSRYSSGDFQVVTPETKLN